MCCGTILKTVRKLPVGILYLTLLVLQTVTVSLLRVEDFCLVYPAPPVLRIVSGTQLVLKQTFTEWTHCEKLSTVMSLPTGTLKPGTLPTAQYPVGLGSFPCLERVEKGLLFSKSRFLLSQEPGWSTLTKE